MPAKRRTKNTTPRMPAQLTGTQAQALLDTFRRAAEKGDTPEFKALYRKFNRAAALILPLGALDNPDMAGLVAAWRMLGRISRQEPGGFCRVDTDLITALRAAETCGPERCAIHVTLPEGVL